jgi:Bacterial Ig domain
VRTRWGHSRTEWGGPSIRGWIGLLVALCTFWVASGVAAAAPPAPGGLELLPGSHCLGTTALATGCVATSQALAAPEGLAMSPDGRTVYMVTAYGSGAVVAIRRSPSGALGPVLNCISASSTPLCSSTAHGFFGPHAIAVSSTGRVYVGTEDNALVAFSVNADGSLKSSLGCASNPADAAGLGCAAANGMGYAEAVTVGPGGTVYVASFLGYTEGSLVSIPTLADGSLGAESGCVQTTGSSGTCSTTSAYIEAGTAVAVAGSTVYVTSSDYKADYGMVTAFSLDPGGAVSSFNGCVGSMGSACSNVVGGLLGARAIAISSDSRLYIAASPIPFGGSGGTLAAFTLRSDGGINTTELNCYGATLSSGCTPASGLLGVDAVAVTSDGRIYTAANGGSGDGAVAAFDRAPSGALASEINCIGVTSATGCATLAPGLDGAAGLAGSPDAATTDFYVASEFNPTGTDGAIVPLTRELSPACASHSAGTTAGNVVTVALGCADPNLDPVTVSVVTQPTHGTLGPVTAGSVTYKPYRGFSGTDSFSVIASDGRLVSSRATVTVTVRPAPAPSLSKLALHPRSFASAARGAPIARASRKTGTTVSYRDTLAAKTTFTVIAKMAGVRSGRRCVKLTRRRKKGQKGCTLSVVAGRFSHADRSGANSFHFTGRVGGKALAPGAYTLSARPKVADKLGKAVTVRFTIVRRAR